MGGCFHGSIRMVRNPCRGGSASGNQIVQYYSNYGNTSVIFPILALVGSGWMLTKWYPLLASLQSAGQEFIAANPGATSAVDPIVAYATALGIPKIKKLEAEKKAE